MKTVCILLLSSWQLFAQDTTKVKSKLFGQQIHYSAGFFRTPKDYHSIDYSLCLNISKRSGLYLKGELIYFKNYKNEIDLDQGNWNKDALYLSVPIYLGFYFKLGQKHRHRLNVDLGVKVWSREPSKRFSNVNFWPVTYWQGEYQSYRKNLLLIPQIGYSYTLWKGLFVDVHLNAMITQVLQDSDPAQKRLGLVPSMRFGLGYRF